MDDMNSTLIVTYRGTKVDIPLLPGTSVLQAKEAVVSAVPATTFGTHTTETETGLFPSDIKLMFKGKVLHDDNQDLFEFLSTLTPTTTNSRKTVQKKKVYRLIATGLSQAEAKRTNQEFHIQQQKLAREVRDDLSDAGVMELEKRKRMGQVLLHEAAGRALATSGTSSKYGFGKIETLPNLPEESQARKILETLAKDPGILACMAKHQWTVGALTELYPEGKVGESPICVMGLNENKGQRIKLRIRTDDLTGFRKMLTIRKVLFHELAHNVHSEHNQDFFVLMRQIEKECNDLDWTQGEGLSNAATPVPLPYQGGTYRLGGGGSNGEADSTTNHLHQQPTRRDLSLRAALQRMTAEEEEIEQNCGCGPTDLFLPPERPQTPTVPGSRGTTDERSTGSNSDDMDLS